MALAMSSRSAVTLASLWASCCAIERCAVQLPKLKARAAREKVRPAYVIERRTDTVCSESATGDEDQIAEPRRRDFLPSSAAKSPRSGGAYSFARRRRHAGRHTVSLGLPERLSGVPWADNG